MARFETIAKALVCASLLLGAVVGCGSEDGFSRDDASASFAAANPEATGAQADCVVDRLIDRYGMERLEAELAAENLSAAFAEDQFRDMFACGIEGDMRAQMVEQLEANAVSEEDAPCVADEIMGDLEDADLDVLLSGEITDDFLAKFISAMDRCGAINQ